MDGNGDARRFRVSGELMDQIDNNYNRRLLDPSEALHPDDSVSVIGHPGNAISNVTGDVSNKSSQEVKGGLDKESIIDKTSSLKSVSKSSIVQPPPITKEDITNVGKDISSSVSSGADIKSNLNIPGAQSPSKEEKRIDNVGNTQAEGQPVSKEKNGNTNINSDFSQLEKRLKNIELLLSGPLEVKIKN